MKLVLVVVSLICALATGPSSSSSSLAGEAVAQLDAAAPAGDDPQVCVRRVWFCEDDWSQHASSAACADACEAECFLDIVCLPGCFCE